MSSQAVRADRIAGALVGLAVGDALGAPYEFRPPLAGLPAMARGRGAPVEWTDDTDMALCIAEVTADGVLDLDRIGRNFMNWAAGYPPDIGSQTSAVIRSAPDAAGLTQAAAEHFRQRPNHAAGNGSLMRTAPVALAFLGDDNAIADAARAVSDLTHGDPVCAEACILWCIAIDRAVEFGRLDGVRDGLALLEPAGRAYWDGALTAAEEATDPSEFGNNGWVVAALQAAYCAVRIAERETEGWARFRTGIHAAVKAGEDTDTVGAIAGMLLGAATGASAIPAEWKIRLRDHHLSYDVCELACLAHLSASHGKNDQSGWPDVRSMVPFYEKVNHPSGTCVHATDGLSFGDVAALEDADADVVVSLCRMGTEDAADAIRLDVHLIDSTDPEDNPNLDFILADTVAFIQERRTEGRSVFVHCVRAEQRTPLVAAALATVQETPRPFTSRGHAVFENAISRLATGENTALVVCAACGVWDRPLSAHCPECGRGVSDLRATLDL